MRHPVAELFDVVDQYPWYSLGACVLLFCMFCVSIKWTINVIEKK